MAALGLSLGPAKAEIALVTLLGVTPLNELIINLYIEVISGGDALMEWAKDISGTIHIYFIACYKQPSWSISGDRSSESATARLGEEKRALITIIVWVRGRGSTRLSTTPILLTTSPTGQSKNT